jgi:hypothetical protein
MEEEPDYNTIEWNETKELILNFGLKLSKRNDSAAVFDGPAVVDRCCLVSFSNV